MKKTSTRKSNLSAIKAQVIAAYSDATPNYNFKASAAVSIENAVNIMVKALDVPDECCQGYNFFKPRFFRYLPPGTKITLAREGSVCAYIHPPAHSKLRSAELIRRMAVDEWESQPDGTIRLWWD